MTWYLRRCAGCGVHLAATTDDPAVKVMCLACDPSDLPMYTDPERERKLREADRRPVIQIFYDRKGKPITLQEAEPLLADFSYVVVAQHWVRGWMVSTVWNGTDIGRFTGGPSTLFETMTFPPGSEEAALHEDLDHRQWRYPTEEAALAGHDQILAMVCDELGASAAEITTAPEHDDVRSLMQGFAAARQPGCPWGSPPGCRCANCYEAQESQP